jgi:hypothetical protein
MSCEVEYLAVHFGQLPERIIVELSISDFTRILSHQSLQLKNEDSLYDLIFSRSNVNEEFLILLEFVRFEFLSNGKFMEFVLWSKEHFRIITESIWFNICRRLYDCPQLRVQSSSVRHSLPPINHSNDPPINNSIGFSTSEIRIEQFPFLHGIVSSLKCEHSSELDRFLKVSSSSIYNSPPNYHCDFATNISPFNGFASENIADSWLEYHFLHAKVYPTHYAIRLCFRSWISKQWPQKWIIERWNAFDERVELNA